MTVMKAVVRGMVLAVLATESARGGSILHLGVNSGVELSVPAASGPVLPSVAPTSSSSLRLGVFDESAPLRAAPSLSPLTPGPVDSPITPAPCPLPVPAMPSPAGYDAFINLGQAPYPPLTRNFWNSGGTGLTSSAQSLGTPAVPEPSAALLWTSIVAAGLVVARSGRRLAVSGR